MKSIKVWDVSTMQPLTDIRAHVGIVKCVKAQRDFKIFATAGDKSDKMI